MTTATRYSGPSAAADAADHIVRRLAEGRDDPQDIARDYVDGWPAPRPRPAEHWAARHDASTLFLDGIIDYGEIFEDIALLGLRVSRGA